MIDYARITVKAGDGGNGVGSFTHIKGRRYGKADGGDGGDGGDVYLGTSADLNTLEPFRYVKDYRAERGKDGLSRRRRGAQGEDLVVKVPVGTVVKAYSDEWSESSEQSRPKNNREKLSINHYSLITDLVHIGDKILIARGGRGGRGNVKLRDEFGRRPKKGETGESGEIKNLILELKLIADVGLIGLPNAGKSTLLSTLTSARPKIAPYPFTTLEPNLGMLEITGPAARIILADIPGLISGASQGKGLGDLFLRHIERTRILLHLIDISEKNFEQIWQDYQTVRAELKAYSKELIKKKEIIVLTKIDLIDCLRVKEVLRLFRSKKKKVLAVSATGGQGLDLLIKTISKLDF